MSPAVSRAREAAWRGEDAVMGCPPYGAAPAWAGAVELHVESAFTRLVDRLLRRQRLPSPCFPAPCACGTHALGVFHGLLLESAFNTMTVLGREAGKRGVRMRSMRRIVGTVLLVLPALAGIAFAQVEKVGAGNLWLAPKGTDKAPPAAPLRTEAMMRQAAPTSQWYSTLIFNPKPDPIYAQPLSFRTTSAGGANRAARRRDPLPAPRRFGFFARCFCARASETGARIRLGHRHSDGE